MIERISIYWKIRRIMSQNFTLSKKSKLLLLQYQSTSVYITTNVCYYKCANNKWRYLKFDNQISRQTTLSYCPSSCTIQLPATAHTSQISTQVLRTVLPLRVFSHFGVSLVPPRPSRLIFQDHTTYCRITSNGRYMKHVHDIIDILNREYIQWILKEILQRIVTFFVRYCSSVLKVIVVNYSVSHLASND